jgi:hypothetical protein
MFGPRKIWQPWQGGTHRNAGADPTIFKFPTIFNACIAASFLQQGKYFLL